MRTTSDFHADLEALKNANEELHKEITLLRHQIDQKSKQIRQSEQAERENKAIHQENLTRLREKEREADVLHYQIELADKENKELSEKLKERETELLRKGHELRAQELKLAELQNEYQKLSRKLHTLEETQKTPNEDNDFVEQKQKLEESKRELVDLKNLIEENKKESDKKDAAVKILTDDVAELKSEVKNVSSMNQMMNSKLDKMMSMMEGMCKKESEEISQDHISGLDKKEKKHSEARHAAEGKKEPNRSGSSDFVTSQINRYRTLDPIPLLSSPKPRSQKTDTQKPWKN